MQQITKQSKVDAHAKLNVFGTKMYLMTPTEITGELDAPGGNPGLHSFKDGVLPPCATFGYDTDGGEGFTVQSIYQLAVDIFGFDRSTSEGTESIEMFVKYIYDIAGQLKLDILELQNGMVIVSSVLHDMAKSGDVAWDEVHTMGNTNRDMQLAMSNAGAATILGKAVEYGSKIYDKFNYVDKISDIAHTIQGMTKVDPQGNAQTLSMADVEEVFSIVKAILHIK